MRCAYIYNHSGYIYPYFHLSPISMAEDLCQLSSLSSSSISRWWIHLSYSLPMIVLDFLPPFYTKYTHIRRVTFSLLSLVPSIFCRGFWLLQLANHLPYLHLNHHLLSPTRVGLKELLVLFLQVLPHYKRNIISFRNCFSWSWLEDMSTITHKNTHFLELPCSDQLNFWKTRKHYKKNRSFTCTILEQREEPSS